MDLIHFCNNKQAMDNLFYNIMKYKKSGGNSGRVIKYLKFLIDNNETFQFSSLKKMINALIIYYNTYPYSDDHNQSIRSFHQYMIYCVTQCLQLQIHDNPNLSNDKVFLIRINEEIVTVGETSKFIEVYNIILDYILNKNNKNIIMKKNNKNLIVIRKKNHSDNFQNEKTLAIKNLTENISENGSKNNDNKTINANKLIIIDKFQKLYDLMNKIENREILYDKYIKIIMNITLPAAKNRINEQISNLDTQIIEYCNEFTLIIDDIMQFISPIPGMNKIILEYKKDNDNLIIKLNNYKKEADAIENLNDRKLIEIYLREQSNINEKIISNIQSFVKNNKTNISNFLEQIKLNIQTEQPYIFLEGNTPKQNEFFDEKYKKSNIKSYILPIDLLENYNSNNYINYTNEFI